MEKISKIQEWGDYQKESSTAELEDTIEREFQRLQPQDNTFALWNDTAFVIYICSLFTTLFILISL